MNLPENIHHLIQDFIFDGECDCTSDVVEDRFFFPLDIKNNPGEEDMPNWAFPGKQSEVK